MNKKLIRLTEGDLHRIVKESVNRILKENASSKLYHFLNFDRFENIVKTDSFTPTNFESKWHNGKNTMSFSRTKSFREGWPVIMYSGDDGKGDAWCAIRLTIDGDLINRKPNFKIDGKQYNMAVKPFDWAYKDMDNGDPYSFGDNYGGIFAQNGKEWMMKSDDYTSSYIPINWGKKSKQTYVDRIGDKQGHPYSQAEDRLTTNAKSIPNACQFIMRVDILLLPYNFSKYDYEDRVSLYNIITNSQLSNKIHVYDKMRNLELGGYELKDAFECDGRVIKTNSLKRVLLTKEKNRKYKNPMPSGIDYKIKQDY
jgi:hypothetical protein